MTGGDTPLFEKALLAMYDHAQQRRGLQIDRIWETMKHTTQIIFAIVTVTGVLLGLFYKDNNAAILILVVFPVLIGGISWWAKSNTKRQYKRFLTIITWINKLEHFLGLHISVNDPEKPALPVEPFYRCDKYFLKPDKWATPKVENNEKEFVKGDEFVNHYLSLKQETMYTSFSSLYNYYYGIAVSLFAAIIVAFFAILR